MRAESIQMLRMLMVWMCCTGIHGYVAPTVTLTSCMHETATVTIENAEEGGIIYFRTDTAYNMIPSTNGTIEHECVFADCNIKWDTKFYVIVQRKVLVQTRNDVIIWFVCSTDFESVQPVVINFDEMLDSNLTTSTYKPEVSMSLLSGSVSLENQAEVKLGTEITMIVRITNDPGGYFDISPKSCYASGITLYEDRCPVSEDLLGAFNTSTIGYTSVTFSMFRPTSSDGGPVAVVFTCILEVCDTVCEEYDCTDTENSTESVRRRRDVRKKNNPSVIRGFTLMVVTEEEEGIIKETRPDDAICLAMFVIFALFGSFFLVTTMTATLAGYNYHRLLKMKMGIDALKLRQNGKHKGLADSSNHIANNQTVSKSFKVQAVSVENTAVDKKANNPDVTSMAFVANGHVNSDSNVHGTNTCSSVPGKLADTNGLYVAAMYSTYRRKSVTKIVA